MYLKFFLFIFSATIFNVFADTHPYYTEATQCYSQKDWKTAADRFKNALAIAPDCSDELTHYYLGVCYFELEEYDLANVSFTNYLKKSTSPEYFREVMEYKFCIAEYFRQGGKRRMLCNKDLPKCFNGHALAIEVYDEIIASFPSDDLTAYSLYGKAELLKSGQQYRESVECLKLLIKRFPKHTLGPESYILISRIYLDQCLQEFQNPDLLALAELNTRKFAQDYPGEERLCMAEQMAQEIKETFAVGFLRTGSFYERICKPQAAILYYRKAIREFPDTQVAVICQERLMRLGGCQLSNESSRFEKTAAIASSCSDT